MTVQFQAVGLTNTPREEIPLPRFGPDSASSCAGSVVFRQNTPPEFHEVCIGAISGISSGRCNREREEIAVRSVGVIHLCVLADFVRCLLSF